MVVLYRRTEGTWKIADFGISAAGSDRAQTTQNARGTSGYRAPELLTGPKTTYTNKVDIWAIGCILYHLVFGKQIFDEDWITREWAISKQPLPWSTTDMKYWIKSPYWVFLETVICAMLAPEPHKRPTAKTLFSFFNAAATSSNHQLPTAEYLTELLQSISEPNIAENL